MIIEHMIIDLTTMNYKQNLIKQGGKIDDKC